MNLDLQKQAMNELTIRPGVEEDLPALVEIYNHYIRQTPITFDLQPYTLESRKPWFAQFAATGRHRLLVATAKDKVIGYASTMQFRTKAAYDPSVETSIYLNPDAQGQGIGVKLYSALFELLQQEDIHRYYAGITIPNEASIRLHLRFGFTVAGTFTEVGRKFGRYWDVVFMERKG